MEVPKFSGETPIRNIQQFQEEYDDQYWEHDRTIHENINHVEHHLGKMIGKIATWTEAVEHGNNPSLDQLKNEVTPDLLFWALHLANLFALDIEEVYQKRLEDNIRRLHSNESKDPLS